MPRTPKYPLEALRDHRERTAARATVELGAALRRRETAEDAKRQAERDQQATEAGAAAVRSDEAKLLAQGDLRAADLARAEAWEYAARAEARDRARAVLRGEEQLTAAAKAETEAKEVLARAKADHDVVAKDEARFAQRALVAREAGEEDAADETFASRVHARRG